MKEKNFDERGLRKRADREFSRKAELESEMARQREQWVHSQWLVIPVLNPFPSRSAKEAAEAEVASKASTPSTMSKIIVPGTPRNTGSRVSQTPRRRLGL